MRIIVRAMTAKLTASLRAAPVTVPAFAALVLFVVWATSQGGYPITHWAPGALAVLVLLVIAVATVRVRLAELPVAVRIAIGCLAAYTVLSFLSILWAAVPGEAWEGADRTLLYLLVFALFAGWRQRGVSAALLLGAWTLAMVALAAFTAVHLGAASPGELQSLIPEGRLTYPTGYANANAAQWLMAMWPALLLARTPRLHWALRGLLAGGAVLLAEVALLSQSRGSLYATPVMLVLVFALLPARVRTFALLVPVGLGIAAAAPAVIHVGDRLHDGEVVASTLHHALLASALAAVVVALVVAAGAAVDSRRAFAPATRARVHRALAGVAVALLVAAVAVGLAVAGNPAKRLHHAWDTFKGGYGADATTGSRLVSGLGSNRYDFYRVALDEFIAHPVAGIGADNFQQQYLLRGRSDETPRYPHSVELRTLLDTGLLGALLAVVGLGAALAAGWRACRPRAPDGAALAHERELAAVVAAAALAGFAYWVVHGSIDWFWEFAGLGAPAFAMLGLACALAPRRRSPRAPSSRPAASPTQPGAAGPRTWRPRGRGLAATAPALAALLALAAALSLAAPWLSQLEIESAAHVWTTAPGTAYARLGTAAELNPLSDEAQLVAGSIALRYGELARADRQFSLALDRVPDDSYAILERGAIASALGHRRRALALLERAARLNPRDQLTREALAVVRDGRRVDIDELNRLILLKAQQLA